MSNKTLAELQEEDETSEEEVEDEGGELDTDGNPIMIFRKKQRRSKPVDLNFPMLKRI